MEILANLFTPDLIRSGIRLATPIVLAAIGGALCNRAGVLNLALEGKMLLGAFVGILAAFFLPRYGDLDWRTHSPASVISSIWKGIGSMLPSRSA